MNDAPALKIEGLRKIYRTGLGKRTRVLEDFGLQVERGEVYGLLGRNGAGKSTTFRLLMGLAKPDGGRIEVLGANPGQRDVLMRVGFCPENPQFPPNLHVDEVLRFHSALVRPRIHTPKNRIDWLLTQLELEGFRHRPVGKLSRGTVQRLALASALLARPELLILDEPLNSLDPLSRRRVIEILREQKLSGTAMIISSHILSDLEDIADRLGVLAGGRLQREIRLAEKSEAIAHAMEIRVPVEFRKAVLADAPDLEHVQLGEIECFTGVPFERAQRLVKDWSAAGIPILELNRDLAPMEQAILDKIAGSAPDGAPASERVEEKV